MSDFAGPGTRCLGLAVPLRYRLVGCVGDAVKSRSRMGHALLDESADLIGHCKLLEGLLRHRQLL